MTMMYCSSKPKFGAAVFGVPESTPDTTGRHFSDQPPTFSFSAKNPSRQGPHSNPDFGQLLAEGPRWNKEHSKHSSQKPPFSPILQKWPSGQELSPTH